MTTKFTWSIFKGQYSPHTPKDMKGKMYKKEEKKESKKVEKKEAKKGKK